MHVNKAVFLGDYHLVDAILRSEAFRVDNPLRGTRKIFGPSVLDTEGERHRNKRVHWSRHFSKRAVEANFSEVIDEAVADGFKRGICEGDLMRTCAFIPNKIVLAMLGLNDIDPLDHYRKIRPIADFLEWGIQTPELEASKAYVRQPMFATNRNIFPEMDAIDRVNEVPLLLLAAAETTVISMKIITALWNNAGSEFVEAVEQHGAEAVAVGVMCRDAPLGLSTRFCVDDTVVNSIEFARGDIVHLNLFQANRERDSPVGSAFGPHRHRDNLIFGSGKHRCAGSHLALRELGAFVEKLASIDPLNFAFEAQGVSSERPTFRHPAECVLRPTDALRSSQTS